MPSSINYPIYNPLARWIITCIDTLLRLCIRSKKTSLAPPKKILLCNTAHLGDVLLTCKLLPSLQAAYPNAEIGMLVGSWAKPIAEKLVDHVHTIDHWKVNRSKKKKKLFRYLIMRQKALKAIQGYDLAIDCGLHFPNMAPLLWQAGISKRIGFETAGFGPLLTHSMPWDPIQNISVVDAYFSLLTPLKINKVITPKKAAERHPYFVIHMGSGNPQKNWPLEKWRTVVKKLVQEEKILYFTGLGEEENQAIEQVTAGLPYVKNLCNQLSWEAFVTLIQQASLLIATDTAAGHVAAQTDTPAVLLYAGIHPSKMWIPDNPHQLIMTHTMPCSPCYTGCRKMTCVQAISTTSVLEAVHSLTFNFFYSSIRARQTLPCSSSLKSSLI